MTNQQIRSIELRDPELGNLLRILAKMDGLMRAMPAIQRAPRATDQKAAQEARQAAQAAAESQADTELRLEVVEAMEAAGIARHVAANRTATRAGLMAEARAYQII